MRVLKYLGIVVFVSVVVAAALFATAWIVSEREIARVYAVRNEAPLTIPTDDATNERGRHFATSVNTCDVAAIIALHALWLYGRSVPPRPSGTH